MLSPAGTRPGASLPAHPEQEPQLHRAPGGQGRLRPRQRARHRAGAALAAARGAAARAPAAAAAACCCRPSCRAFVRQAVHRHQGDRLLPVPRHPQQRPVRRRGRNRRPAARARGRARAPPLRRRGAPGDLATTARRTWCSSCCGSSRSATLDLYSVPGPVNLNRLSAIYDLVQRPDLKYPIFTPGMPRAPGRRHRHVRGDPPQGHRCCSTPTRASRR